MTSIFLPSIVIGACAALASACTFGNPVVDQRGFVGPTDCGDPAPACEPDPAGLAAVGMIELPEVGGDIELGECRPSCASGGEVAPSCGRSVVVEGDGELGIDGATDCIAITIEPEPAIVTPMVAVWRGASVRSANLVVASAVPLEITLEEMELIDVTVRLAGPVTLRITGDRAVSRVRVFANATAHGRPRLELYEAEAEELVVGSDEDAFEGSVLIERTFVERSRFFVANLELKSAILQAFSVAARELVVTDALLRQGTFDVGDAILSAVRINQSEIRRCDTLFMVGAFVGNTVISACSDGPTRVFSSSVAGGNVEGEVESDATSWSSVRFGLEGALDLVAWQTIVTSSTFCDHTQRLRLSTSSKVHCAVCAPDVLQAEGAACLDPGSSTDVRISMPACAALEAPDVCDSPLPPRRISS